MQDSASVDQEFASMCLRLHKREILWQSPPSADVLLTDCSASPGVVTDVADFGFRVFVAGGVWMNLGKGSASMGFSYAGLCRRGLPERLKCGDHGVKSIAFNAAGTHRAGSWRRRTGRLLMSPAAVPVRCSSHECVTSNQRPVTHGCKS